MVEFATFQFSIEAERPRRVPRINEELPCTHAQET